MIVALGDERVNAVAQLFGAQASRRKNEIRPLAQGLKKLPLPCDGFLERLVVAGKRMFPASLLVSADQRFVVCFQKQNGNIMAFCTAVNCIQNGLRINMRTASGIDPERDVFFKLNLLSQGES